MQTPEVSQATNTTSPEVQAKEITFGNGRYGKAAHELFKDVQRLFKVSPVVGEKIARAWMADFGKLIADSQVTVKASGMKDLTLREACAVKVKKDVITNPIAIMRLVAYLDEGFKVGLMPANCTYVLTENLADYLKSLQPAPAK